MQLIEKIKKTGFHQSGQTYVLIGRVTISAAIIEKTNAILIGEPTGSRPISYSENDEIFLLNSKLEILYSTKFYKFQEEDTKGVYPDVRIDPNYEELKIGNDTTLEWVLKQKNN